MGGMEDKGAGRDPPGYGGARARGASLHSALLPGRGQGTCPEQQQRGCGGTGGPGAGDVGQLCRGGSWEPLATTRMPSHFIS